MSERVIFYSTNDLSLGSNYEQAVALLQSDYKQTHSSIVDAIELYQCFLIMSSGVRLASETEEFHSGLVREAGRAKGFAYSIVHHQIVALGFDCALLQAEEEFDYADRFWALVGACKAYEKCQPQDIAAAIAKKAFRLRHACRCEWPSYYLPHLLREALLADPVQSAEIILDKYAVAGDRGHRLYLPNNLVDDDINSILQSYACSDDPNTNYLRAAIAWPPDTGKRLSSDTLVVIKKALRRQDELLFSEGTSITFGVEVAIEPNQIECLHVNRDGLMMRCSYSGKWLEETLDPPSILNNLLHIFTVVDGDGLISMRSNGKYTSVFVDTLMHPKGAYRQNEQSIMEEMRIRAILPMYDSYLLSHGSSIEEALGWYYNRYIKECFDIKGFGIAMPSVDVTPAERCRAIAPEIERVLKTFSVYCKHREIDPDYYEVETFGGFENVPSLMEKKYARGLGDTYNNMSYLLFSSQSNLHVAFHQVHGDCFATQVLSGEVKAQDVPAWARSHFDYLVEHSCVGIDGDGYVRLMNKTTGIKKLWDNGSYPYATNSKIAPCFEYLESVGEAEAYSRLFSKEEADYLNYVYNKRGFSNNLGLRDRFAHGSNLLGDAGDKEAEGAYWHLLAVLICATLKINEELNLHTRVNLEQEFVDCPLLTADLPWLYS